MRALIKMILIALLLSSTNGFAENSSLATGGKKMTIVAKGAAFGLGGGLIVGLASQVFSKNSRRIWMFGSLGMYVGIGVGLYVVLAPKGTTPYEGPDTYEDFTSSSRERLIKPEQLNVADTTRVDVPIYHFEF